MKNINTKKNFAAAIVGFAVVNAACWALFSMLPKGGARTAAGPDYSDTNAFKRVTHVSRLDNGRSVEYEYIIASVVTNKTVAEMLAEQRAAEAKKSGGDAVKAAEIPLSVGEARTSRQSDSSFVIDVDFSEELNFSKIGRAQIYSEPAVELSFSDSGWSWWRRINARTVRIHGKFAPDTQYKIVFQKGVAADNGRALAEDAVRTVRTPDFASQLRISAAGRYLPPSGALAVPFESMNSGSNIGVRVSAVPPRNITQLMARENDRYSSSRRYWGSASADDSDTRELALASVTGRVDIAGYKKNELFKGVARLGDFMGAARRGVFLLELESDHAADVSRLVCVSDLAISARRFDGAGREMLVWVTSLTNGAPVAGAKVEAWSANNMPAGAARTDENGLARISVAKGAKGAANASAAAADDEDEFRTHAFVLTAESADGEDWSFMPLADGTEEDAPGASRKYFADSASEIEAFVYADRAIYRHGDPIRAQALLRDASVAAPAPFPVRFDLVAPDGKVFRSQTALADETGCATPAEAFSVPENQRSGRWRARVSQPGEKGARLGEAEFSVESFAPPQIRVAASASAKESALGEALELSVGAEYFFGKKAAGLAVDGVVSFGDAEFEPEGWEEFIFGDERRSARGGSMQISKSALDGNGAFKFAFTNNNSSHSAPAAAARLNGSFSVYETGGRPVSASAQALLHAYPFYIGARLPAGGFVSTTESNNVAIALVNPDGSRFGGARELTAKLSKVDYIYTQFKSGSGFWRWKEEAVRSVESEWNISVGGDFGDAAALELKPIVEGRYELEISDADPGAARPRASTFVSFYASAERGNSAERAALGKSAKLEISFDKKEYAPGEIAEAKITAPFAGAALFSVYQDRVFDAQILRPTNSTFTARIPVTDDMFPNVFVSASVIKPAIPSEAWLAFRAYGSAMLKVTRPENRAAIDIAATAEIVARGARVAVNIEAQNPADLEGGYATIYLVDEALHLLGNYATPDPFAHFDAPRGLASAHGFYDIYGLLLPIVDDAAASSAVKIGGDDAAPLARRVNPVKSRRFIPLALAAENIPFGADGKITREFLLPDWAGEVRATAVVRTKTRSGSAAAAAKVAPKLALMPDAPRVLAAGDSAWLTLALHNTTPEPIDAELSANFAGAFEPARTNAAVRLAANESRLLRFPVKAGETIGAATAVFTAAGAGEEHSQGIEIPVRPAMPLVSQVEIIELKEREIVTLAVPTNVLASTYEQRVRASNNSFARFIPALSYLLGYPYGCLEQTTSSAFPLVHAGAALARATETTLGAGADENLAKVRHGIRRVASLQNSNGYHLWHDVPNTDDYLTTYASHFLAEAAAAHPAEVPKAVLDRNVELLKRILSSAQYSSDDVAAYALHVLALSGKPDKHAMHAFNDRRNELSPLAKAHLSRAFALSNDRARALAIAKEIGPPASVPAASFAMLAWLETDAPESKAEILSRYRYLAERQDALAGFHWGTTQDNALALLAIGALAKRAAATRDELNISFTDPSTCRLSETIGAAPNTAVSSRAIIANNTGSGMAYLVREQSAAPLLQNDAAHSNGITITRSLHDRAGAPADPAKLAVGDIITVRLDIALADASGELSDAVIEELLPACFEVSSASEIKTEKPGFTDQYRSLLRSEVRDDRLVVFLKPIAEPVRITYTAQVVTAGVFTHPPASIEGMYRPEMSSRTATGILEVSLP